MNRGLGCAAVAFLAAPVALVMTLVLFVVVIASPDEDCVTGAVVVPSDGLPDVTTAGLSGDGATRAEQTKNAAAIMNAAQALGLPAQAQIVGVAVAMGESSLVNVDYGDDIHGVTNPDGSATCSLGLFQQQWCLGWGTREQVMNPTYAATKFFESLAKVPGWESLPVTIAGHRVQRNADPYHYEKYETNARTLVTALSLPSSSTTPAATAGAGSYENGKIPVAALCELSFAVGKRLRCDAAAQLEELEAKFEAKFGAPLGVTDAYRSLEEQVALKATKPVLAAAPGTSQHGWGLAVDLGSGIASGTSAQYQWMREQGPAYGWDNPAWARPNGSKPEPWHFEYPSGQTPTTPKSAGSCPAPGGTSGLPVAAGGWTKPLADAPRISSPFGMRFHPVYHTNRLHAGTDMPMPCGTPIYAAASGVVVAAAGSGSESQADVVRIDHGAGITSGYVHMPVSGIYVRPGDQVTAGQHIADVGNEGASTACHLHFEIHTDGTPTDPAAFMHAKGTDLP